MSDKNPRESNFQRFMHWAEGEDPGHEHEVMEDPERREFMEYLEYLDTHEHIDFGDYRLMRYRERAAKGLPQPVSSHGHHGGELHDGGEMPTHRRHRPGQLKRLARIYRALSILICAMLMITLCAVVLRLPAFGSSNAPAVNEVSDRYLEKGIEETGAVNAVAGMILDYRAFDTFGESTVLFAAAMSVVLLMRRPSAGGRKEGREQDLILGGMGRLVLPAVMMYGVYVVLNGHLSPGGGFSGGTVLGCGLILAALVVGEETMERLLPPERMTRLTVGCLLAYGLMKGYSFFTGANHVGWDVPKGIPGAILSSGFILPLNICVGIIVACTMYTFYTLFSEKEG